MLRRLTTIILSMLICALTGTARTDVHVGLVTCYPGSDIYELEGHTAIHLQGLVDDHYVDYAINYGLFDFNAPNFVYRFVKGETDYWVGACSWDDFVASYQRHGRKVVEHSIPMDSIQTQRLVALINDNLQPWNRVYRYNYVLDNCATRPLRIIEKALGDSIILPEPELDGTDDHTFRDVMRRYHRNYPWYQFGIDLALGSGIDRPISVREKSFAPIVLDQQLAAATVNGRPLTDGSAVVVDGHDVTEPMTPPYATPTAVGYALLALAIALTIRDQRQHRVTRWFDAVLYGAFGILGLIITFLIFVSTHYGSSPNYLYLWLNPLCMIVPALIWLKKCNIVVISYHFINFALILIMCIIWPMTGQSGNSAFIPLICCDLLRSANYIIINRSILRTRPTQQNAS